MNSRTTSDFVPRMISTPAWGFPTYGSSVRSASFQTYLSPISQNDTLGMRPTLNPGMPFPSFPLGALGQQTSFGVNHTPLVTMGQSIPFTIPPPTWQNNSGSFVNTNTRSVTFSTPSNTAFGNVTTPNITHVSETGLPFNQMQYVSDNMINNTQRPVNSIPLPSQTVTQPTALNCHSCHKNRVDPPTYNGKEKWDTFISLFEKVSDINKWDGSEKCKRLLVSLRGSALEFADTLQLRITKDFDLLKDALAGRFGIASNESLYRVKFKGRRRNANESLDKFMQELQYLAERAYPNEKGEIYYRLIIEQFMDGINNKECKNYLRLNLNMCQTTDNGLIQEVLKYAHNYESVMGRSDQIQKPNNDTTNAVRQDNDSKTKQQNTKQYQGNKNQGNNYQRKIICFHCSAEGHIASRCPLKQAQEQQENSTGLH